MPAAVLRLFQRRPVQQRRDRERCGALRLLHPALVALCRRQSRSLQLRHSGRSLQAGHGLGRCRQRSEHRAGRCLYEVSAHGRRRRGRGFPARERGGHSGGASLPAVQKAHLPLCPARRRPARDRAGASLVLLLLCHRQGLTHFLRPDGEPASDVLRGQHRRGALRGVQPASLHPAHSGGRRAADDLHAGQYALRGARLLRAAEDALPFVQVHLCARRGAHGGTVLLLRAVSQLLRHRRRAGHRALAPHHAAQSAFPLAQRPARQALSQRSAAAPVRAFADAAERGAQNTASAALRGGHFAAPLAQRPRRGRLVPAGGAAVPRGHAAPGKADLWECRPPRAGGSDGPELPQLFHHRKGGKRRGHPPGD